MNYLLGDAHCLSASRATEERDESEDGETGERAGRAGRRWLRWLKRPARVSGGRGAAGRPESSAGRASGADLPRPGAGATMSFALEETVESDWVAVRPVFDEREAQVRLHRSLERD